jgi:hypothetical protein
MGRWRSILEGELAARTSVVVAEIASALRAPLPATAGFGPALFFRFLHDVTHREEDARTAIGWLEVEANRQQPMPGLHDGLLGLAWLASSFSALDVDTEEICAPIERAVLSSLQKPRWEDSYDLASGLVGAGVYLLSRPSSEAEAGLRRIVSHLHALSVEREGGVTWLTPPPLLPEWQRKQAPDGYYDLGVAHGVPGILGLLGALHQRGIETERTASLAERVVPWMLSQRLPPGSGSSFPRWVGPGIAPAPSRVAWCYGDLGLSVVLLGAARQFYRPDWEGVALDAARGAAGMPPHLAGLEDACLCHGAAGNGHLFDCLFHATADACFKDAAERSFELALTMRGHGEVRVAGYSFLGNLDSTRWSPTQDFLTGVAGTGLALLSALNPVEPWWDAVLLSSAARTVPPVPSR